MGKKTKGGIHSAGMHAVSYYGIQCHRRLRYLDSSADDRPHTRVHTCVRNAREGVYVNRYGIA